MPPFPTLYRVKDPQTAEAWASLSGYAAEGAGSAIALESGNLPPYGGNALRLSNSNAGGTGQTSNFAHSLINAGSADAVLEIPVFLPMNFIGGSFTVELGSSGAFATDKYGKSLTSSKTLRGWNLFSWRLSDMTITGAPNPQALNCIRLKATAPAGVVSYAIVGPLTIGGRTRSQIMLVFDDGLKTVYANAKPLLDARNMRATVAIGGGSMYGPTTFSQSEMDAIYQAGWDVGSHLYDQAPILTSGYTAGQQQEQIEKNIAFLRAQGYSRSAYQLYWPGGEYDDDTRALARQAGIAFGRTTQSDNVSTGAGGLYQADILGSWSFDSGSRTVSAWLAALDQVIARGHHMIGYGHNVVPVESLSTDISITNLTTLLDGLATRRKAGLIDIVTPSDFVAGVSYFRPIRA